MPLQKLKSHLLSLGLCAAAFIVAPVAFGRERFHCRGRAATPRHRADARPEQPPHRRAARHAASDRAPFQGSACRLASATRSTIPLCVDARLAQSDAARADGNAPSATALSRLKPPADPL